jgi:hypothetical protein
MATTKGIMGLARFNGRTIRVTSLTLKATQDIAPSGTVDGIYDHTAYVLGPIKIEGDITFPVPATDDTFNEVMRVAVLRDDTTGTLLTRNIRVDAKYDYAIGYAYTDCQVDRLSVNVASEEAIDFTMSLIGVERIVGAASKDYVAPVRVLAWNDVSISGTPSLASEQVRNFSFEIANNTSTFYGLDGSILTNPVNIVAGKRDVTGTIEIAWNGSGLENFAYVVNQEVCRETADLINFDLSNCGGTGGGLTFLGIIFEMEDISMTNDFFMGTQNWRAYGDDGNGYKAIIVN